MVQMTQQAHHFMMWKKQRLVFPRTRNFQGNTRIPFASCWTDNKGKKKTRTGKGWRWNANSFYVLEVLEVTCKTRLKCMCISVCMYLKVNVWVRPNAGTWVQVWYTIIEFDLCKEIQGERWHHEVSSLERAYVFIFLSWRVDGVKGKSILSGSS